MTHQALDLFPFYWPYKYQIHPDYDLAEESARAFLDEFQLYWDDKQRERMRRTQCGTLAAMSFPFGTREALLAYTKYYVWAFTYDDEILDERPEGFDMQFTARTNFDILRTLETTEYPRPGANKYGLAIRDIRMHIDRVAGALAGEQYKDMQYEYITNESHKMALRIAGERPTVDQYLIYRMYCGGSFAFPSTGVLLNGDGLRKDLIEDRRVRVLREIVGLIGGWDNDLYAHPYEDEATGDGIGAVNLLKLEKGCSSREALYAAFSIRDRMATLYGRIREELLNEDPERFGSLLLTLEYYHAGALNWIGTTRRYVAPDTLEATYKFNGVCDTPHDPSTEPPPYPSIAWWWDYDPARRRKSKASQSGSQRTVSIVE